MISQATVSKFLDSHSRVAEHRFVKFGIGIDLAPGSVKFGSRTYTDLQASYQLAKGTELYFGLNNAFDTKPPAIISGMPDSNTGTETAAGTYDPIGRRWYAGVRVKL